MKKPLAIRAQTCSFMNMEDTAKVKEILAEISEATNHIVLEEILKMPAMNELFVNATRDKLFFLNLSKNAKGKQVEAMLRIKIPKKLAPPSLLDRFDSTDQIKIAEYKVRKKGDYIYFFLSYEMEISQILTEQEKHKHFVDPNLN